MDNIVYFSSDADIGAYLKKRRRQLNIRQEELAEFSGVSQPNISNIERGVSTATLETYIKLLSILGVDMAGVIRR